MFKNETNKGFLEKSLGVPILEEASGTHFAAISQWLAQTLVHVLVKIPFVSFHFRSTQTPAKSEQNRIPLKQLYLVATVGFLLLIFFFVTPFLNRLHREKGCLLSLYANTLPFLKHPGYFVYPTVDTQQKSEFQALLDAMLHAKTDESLVYQLNFFIRVNPCMLGEVESIEITMQGKDVVL